VLIAAKVHQWCNG